MTERVLRAELDRLLHDAEYRHTMHRDMADLLHVLGGAGASARVASAVWKSLNGGA